MVFGSEMLAEGLKGNLAKMTEIEIHLGEQEQYAPISVLDGVLLSEEV